MNILYTPAIDMIIFALVAYAIAYYLYIRIFKKDFSAVASADIKVSLILLSLVVAVYYDSGTQVNVFGAKVHWLPYYLFISGLIEIALLLVYKRITGITWKQIGGGIK